MRRPFSRRTALRKGPNSHVNYTTTEGELDRFRGPAQEILAIGGLFMRSLVNDNRTEEGELRFPPDSGVGTILLKATQARPEQVQSWPTEWRVAASPMVVQDLMKQLFRADPTARGNEAVVLVGPFDFLDDELFEDNPNKTRYALISVKRG